jgi:hypothetical protein
LNGRRLGLANSAHFDVSGILRNVTRTVFVFRARSSGGVEMKSLEETSEPEETKIGFFVGEKAATYGRHC